jgi:ADP-ribosylglycohydrolase
MSVKQFRERVLGSLYASLIGDAMGTPTEGMAWPDIEQKYGTVEDFEGSGTDDTLMKNVLADALIRTAGMARMDDWADQWLSSWDALFPRGKLEKFALPVLNASRKLRSGYPPCLAAVGNVASSSSAMCISPVGIVNAGDPESAARQAWELGGLIHTGDVAFCRDGAAAMAAAVAEALAPEPTTETVLAAARGAILPKSGAELLEMVDWSLTVAREQTCYEDYREAVYEHGDRYFRAIKSDSRETVPTTLALLLLADCDPNRAVVFGANFGRDADTIASMAGSVAGAVRGLGAIREAWVAKAGKLSPRDLGELADGLIGAASARHERRTTAASRFTTLLDATGD